MIFVPRVHVRMLQNLEISSEHAKFQTHQNHKELELIYLIYSFKENYQLPTLQG